MFFEIEDTQRVGARSVFTSIGFCLPPIDVSERLAVSIKHLEAAWNLLNGPWRGGHHAQES